MIAQPSASRAWRRPKGTRMMVTSGMWVRYMAVVTCYTEEAPKQTCCQWLAAAPRARPTPCARVRETLRARARRRSGQAADQGFEPLPPAQRGEGGVDL